MLVPRSDGLLPDRFVEIDLDWFPPGDIRAVDQFVERVAPLWEGRRGERGVVLNPGFLVDILTEFSGDVDMHLPLRAQRYARWRQASYADLAALAAELRRSAQRLGVDDLRVGILVAGVGRVITGTTMYDLESDWCDRHPELYPFDLSPLPGPDLDPRRPLAADDHPYASRPHGVTAGMPFAELLAGQWAAVADACRLDVIHLRDGFWGPMLYTRRGPYGVTASDDPEQNDSWTVAIADLFATVKQVRPESTVMAYTSGIGATAEWRSGCVDTEAVLAAGGVDVLIDQTWGGAWQDWWDDWWKGWTNQHANLLSHAVAARGAGNVRHYKLVETWDGWEPFDTVHAVPGKLRWAMWAWSHAAVVTPDGLEVPDGTYLSWMNDKDLDLLDAEAIAFVARELGAAEASAARMTRVGGPLLVFDRAAVAARRATAPSTNGSEHLEDAAALMLKWGAPILGATRAEWVDQVDTRDGVIVQLGGGLTADSLASVPLGLVVGRADAVDGDALAAAGCVVDRSDDGSTQRAGYRREQIADTDLPSGGWVHLAGQVVVSADGDDVQVLAHAADRPTLVARHRWGWWQPPELVDPANPLLPRSQYGSVASAAAAARWLGRDRGGAAQLAVECVPYHLPVTVQWWYEGDHCHVLAGNLETGWIGDSRTPRTATLRLDGTPVIVDVPPESCALVEVRP
jgi:hypothetical protein